MIAKKQKPFIRNLAAEKKQRKIDELTRKVAIAVVFIAVFYFFIKLLFL